MVVPFALLSLLAQCALAAAPVDWIDRSPSGAYQFGYATGDSGGHYREEAASADNTIAGKYGFRDPASGANLETTYTSGRRGFRARGPHIARRMGLSQAGPLRPQDDGKYHPELDNVFDPSEDRGYDFQYRTKDTVKEEHADARGDVRGRYSFLDDVGGRHTVDYTAGANAGFNVINPVPDSFPQAQGSPLVFHGKGPGSRARGFTAVQKSPDGSYKFAASGPDHKRTEVSDSLGNRRGSYSYLDDSGQLRTVEYIAGPNIGYQVINGRRPLLFPSSASASPFPTTPFFPVTANPTVDWTGTTPQPPSSPWATPSTPSWLDAPSSPGYQDLGNLHHQLFPESLNTASSGPVTPSNNQTSSTQAGSSGSGGSCCGRSWNTGPKRDYRANIDLRRQFSNQSPARALRAHVQNVDLGEGRYMSPGEAIELFGDPEHRVAFAESRVSVTNVTQSNIEGKNNTSIDFNALDDSSETTESSTYKSIISE